MKANKFLLPAVLLLVLLSAFALVKQADKGFKPMFDGKTLNGWEGDPRYWRVEDGEIIGEVTPATLLKANTFLIWKGGHAANFELKVSYRITEKGNSGLNYRSVRIDSLPYILKGYQQDIDGKSDLGYPIYTGQNY